MAITEMEIKKLKPKDKRYYIRDDRGLYIEVYPSGAKSWRVRSWVNGKEHKKSIGTYPAMSLKEARRARDVLALEGKPEFSGADITFRDLSERWFADAQKDYSSGHTDKVIYRLDKYILPNIGNKKLKDITGPLILDLILEPLDDADLVETAHRVLGIIRQSFAWGVGKGLAEKDPTYGLQKHLSKRKHTHFPSLKTPREIGGLMRNIAKYEGGPIVKDALFLSAYVFLRPSEIRGAEWAEFDFEENVWRIPAERMKGKKPHLVPLSTQVLALLKHLKKFSGHGRYLFPSMRSTENVEKPISDGTVNMAIRAMGYSNKVMVAHGFRSMASTILNESGKWRADAIEKQLAHNEQDETRDAYNYAKYLPERKKMMQWWADWLEKQRKTIPEEEKID